MNNFIKIIPARAGHCTANYNLLLPPGMTDFNEFIRKKFHVNFRSCHLASCFKPTTLIEIAVDGLQKNMIRNLYTKRRLL